MHYYSVIIKFQKSISSDVCIKQYGVYKCIGKYYDASKGFEIIVIFFKSVSGTVNIEKFKNISHLAEKCERKPIQTIGIRK